MPRLPISETEQLDSDDVIIADYFLLMTLANACAMYINSSPNQSTGHVNHIKNFHKSVSVFILMV